MDAIFMNSGNTKKADPYRVLLSLLEKIKMNRHIYQIYQI